MSKGLGEAKQLELLARAVEQVADAVEICGADYRLLYVNRAFERLTGYSRDEAVGHTPQELLRGELHPPSFFDDIEATGLAGRVWSGRIRSRDKTGRMIVCDAVVSPVLDEAGQVSHFMCVRRDVTEREHLETKLMQSDRLAAVGHLAAGVAHEINNPLAYVFGNTAFLQETLVAHPEAFDADTREDLRSALADLEHGAARIRDIVRDLGAFSRPSEDSASEVDLHSALDSSINLLHNEVKHRAQLERQYGQVPPVWAERSRIGQLFLNLILNAVQAIPVGFARDNEIRVITGTDGEGNARIEIRDTGEGIRPEILPQIFDPFFTTRSVGEGTGLGLSVAHTIVQSLGGHIAVASDVGVGTSFTVTIPSMRAMVERIAAAGPAVSAGRRGRVLLVDDDPGVLRAMSRMLRDHDVTTCGSGAEALALLERQRDFDIVLCDLMMPDLSGMDLFARTTSAYPELRERFVFITGGAYTVQAQRFLGAEGLPTVQKPFEPRTLRDLVARLVVQRRD
jgi:two-component system, cell cycle sensor histidine kinase and response regulator CckA